MVCIENIVIKKECFQTVSWTVCKLCQHRVKCWSLAEVVLLWCGAVLSFSFRG